MTFRGSTGATHYELWSSPTDMADWILVSEEVLDSREERAAHVSMPADTLERVGFSSYSSLRFCLRACSDPGQMRLPGPTPSASWMKDANPCFFAANASARCDRWVPPKCSECSNEVTLTLGARTENNLDTPWNCSEILWVAHDYQSLWWSYRELLFDFRSPAYVDTAILALALATLALAGVAFALRKRALELDCRVARLAAPCVACEAADERECVGISSIVLVVT